ncbi:MAG: AAA family ATPase [Flavobacteriaceae bacterium]|jgi:hypothetical protein|nr:AAA family ATPase [Flavobacteriaceae bacterium]
MQIEKFIQTHSEKFNQNRFSDHTNQFDKNFIFGEKRRSYLNELGLFMSYFGEIPNFIEEENINCKKALEWFLSQYRNEIKNLHYSKIQLYSRKNSSAEFDDLLFILNEDLLIYFDTNNSDVRFLFRKTKIDFVETIRKSIIKFRHRNRRSTPEIHLIVNEPYGLDLEEFLIQKPKLKIEDNYNDDFLAVHKTILSRLQKKKDKGLILLHGNPGTGKTSYIRYLITSLKKKVIFLPPNMATEITNPNLMKLLINNPNSVFVIEDAENIIMDREENGYSPVSTLLNLSDGLLSDCLNIQIICSFNTDLSKVDSALLRKGRLIAQYEFKELETQKAQQLSDKLGFQTQISKPMNLTDIYNQKEMNFENGKTRIPIGFGKN